MRISLFILFVCFTNFCAPNLITQPMVERVYRTPIPIEQIQIPAECSQAIEKVERIYKKAQARHEYIYPIEHYRYEIFPISMFPFFCIPKDTLRTFQEYKTGYLEDSKSIGIFTDSLKTLHIQLAALQYITIGRNIPWMKTYTLYFLKYDGLTKEWKNDRDPMAVILTSKSDSTYKCILPK